MRRDMLALVVVVVGAGAFLMAKRARASSGTTIDDLQASGAATEHGIDNAIPATLLRRARGLALVVDELRAAGFRVTSMYRSPLLNAFIRAQARDPETSIDLSRLTPDASGAHPDVRALDLGADGGPSTDARVIAATLTRAKTLPLFARCLTRAVQEGDHLHVEFSAPLLDALGGEQGVS